MSTSPLPLPGRFHELSLTTGDIRASVEFYERLGFSQAATADTYTHPYGVLTDGRLHVGLHHRNAPSPILTFVRAGLAGCLDEFAARGIELTLCHVGEEQFNQIGFQGPHGEAVRVIEARTYSPTARSPGEPSLCGDFAEVSLPVAEFAAAQAFFEPLGFVATGEAERPYLHLPLTSDHLDLAFHRSGTFDEPLIVFRAPDMDERIERLGTLGFSVEHPLPRGLSRSGNALLVSPEGTHLLLLQEEQ